MDGYLLDLQSLDPFQKWTLICAAALTVLYVVMRPFKKRKDPLARPAGALSLAGQREVEKQMTELLVELEQMARQMTAQLDTRAARLEALIREADVKIARLEAAGGSVSETGSSAAAHGPMSIVPPADPRHLEVYELADQGMSSRQIAQQLDRPHGEIDLILALRSRDPSSAPAR